MALRSLQATEERRHLGIASAGVGIREASDGKPALFYGHAAVFNKRAAIGNPLTWGFYEQLAEGAFTKTLSECDARFLIDHDSSMVVARMSAGNLRLSQDSVGLAVDSDLDMRLSYVSDLSVNLEIKNITGMSFGFYVVKDQWDIEEVELSTGDTAEVEVRTILEVRLLEVSAVTFPAYEETDAGLRALAFRSDRAAIERRLPHLPAAAKLLADIDSEPGETTRDSGDKTEPAEPTRNSVALLKLRTKATGSLYGLGRN